MLAALSTAAEHTVVEDWGFAVADWRVIDRTSQTLVRLVEQRLNQAGIPGVDVRLVTSAAFKDLSAAKKPTISLFLYQVRENPERRNASRRPGPDGQPLRQPMALELGYMITPWGSRKPENGGDDSLAASEETRLMGLILQAFYDHAEVGSSDLSEDPAAPVWRAGDTLQIVLESLPVEDHYRIWDASELGYRLSLTYRVRVADLDTAEGSLAPRVIEAVFEGKP